MILSIVAALVAFVLALLLGVPYIDFLKKKMLGQYIRDEAPESHAKKGGTPTTGGVFLVTFGCCISVYGRKNLNRCVFASHYIYFLHVCRVSR